MSFKFSTMKSSSYCLPFSVYWILPTRFFTVTDAHVARRPVILVKGISCLLKLTLRSSSGWRPIKNFDVPQSTRNFSGKVFATFILKVMRLPHYLWQLHTMFAWKMQLLTEGLRILLTLLDPYGAPHLRTSTVFINPPRRCVFGIASNLRLPLFF